MIGAISSGVRARTHTYPVAAATASSAAVMSVAMVAARPFIFTFAPLAWVWVRSSACSARSSASRAAAAGLRLMRSFAAGAEVSGAAMRCWSASRKLDMGGVPLLSGVGYGPTRRRGRVGP